MKKLNLCLHTGGRTATLDEVTAVKTPAPEGIWHPIAHRTIYDQVVSALNTLNMRVINEEHALAKDGMRYFGLLQIGNCKENEDYSYVVGLRGSLDKTYAAGLTVGSGVFVCDNLAFTGEITIARKYTTHIERDLPVLTARAVGQLQSKWIDMDKRFEAYKAEPIGDESAHDMVIRALDAGAITTQQVPYVVREWRHPRYDELAAQPKTAWRLFNGFTETMKDVGAFNLPKRTQALHALFDAQCGLVTSRESLTENTVDAEVVHG